MQNSNDQENYYTLLGVDPLAPDFDSKLKAAFRSKAKQFHPDSNKSPTAEATFKAVCEAYNTLKDPASRQAYDRTLVSEFQRSAHPYAKGHTYQSLDERKRQHYETFIKPMEYLFQQRYGQNPDLRTLITVVDETGKGTFGMCLVIQCGPHNLFLGRGEFDAHYYAGKSTQSFLSNELQNPRREFCTFQNMIQAISIVDAWVEDYGTRTSVEILFSRIFD